MDQLTIVHFVVNNMIIVKNRLKKKNGCIDLSGAALIHAENLPDHSGN
jgi:hypothetical protein